MPPRSPYSSSPFDAIGRAGCVTIVAPFAIVFVLIFSLPLRIYQAYVAQFYWSWFAAPFTASSPPPLLILAGALTAIRLATYTIPRRGATADEKVVTYNFFLSHLLNAVMISGFWLIGYVLHQLDLYFQ